MNKKITKLLVAMTLAVLMVFSVCAAETETTTVYLAQNGTGDGTSASTPAGTFAYAVKALGGKAGTIVVVGDFTCDKAVIPENAGDITITGGRLVLASDFTLAKNTNNNVVTFDLPVKVTADSAKFIGGFNSIVFTENFAVEGTLNFFGGADYAYCEDGTITDENTVTHTSRNWDVITEIPYSITVNGGTFNSFAGGSNRAMGDGRCQFSLLGSIAAPITITINGGTFGDGDDFTADSAIKLGDVFSISGHSILADNATLIINGGTFNTPIYAMGYIGQTSTRSSASSHVTKSNPMYYAADGEVAITVNGGILNGCEISAFQNTASYNQLLRGNFTLTIGEDAVIKSGMVLDATQVKAYNDVTDKKATLNYPTGLEVKEVRFDIVNDVEKTYDEPLRIACVGDSITQGTGAKVGSIEVFEEWSYPAQLLKQAVGAEKDVIIGNFGCGATKVMNYSGLGYTDGLAYKLSMEECDADYIIIGLGTNDANTASTSIGHTNCFINDYTAFVSGYEALPDTDMVFGTSAIYRNSTDLGAVGVVRAIQEKVLTEGKAEGKKFTYIDLYALTLDAAVNNQLLASDILHPHKDGYTIYADKIFNAIFNGVCEVENFEMDEIYVSAAGRNNGAGTQEDPTSNLAVAFAKAAPEATIYIVGEFRYEKLAQYVPFNTPYSVDKLTIRGVDAADGTKPVLYINSALVYLNCDTVLDNIKLACELTTKDSAGNITKRTASAYYLSLRYNNVTLSETFTTNASKPTHLALGYIAHDVDRYASGFYTPAEDISSDKDCTININGGTFSFIIGGNFHWSGKTQAPYATYSGDMIINIGEGVSITTSSYIPWDAAVGMNYLTGSVTMNINAWKSGAPVREYSKLGGSSVHSATHDEGKNTGNITINISEALTAAGIKVAKFRDFDDDGQVTVADVLLMIGYSVDGVPATAKPHFFDKTEINLINLVRALKAVVAQ